MHAVCYLYKWLHLFTGCLHGHQGCSSCTPSLPPNLFPSFIHQNRLPNPFIEDSKYLLATIFKGCGLNFTDVNQLICTTIEKELWFVTRNLKEIQVLSSSLLFLPSHLLYFLLHKSAWLSIEAGGQLLAVYSLRVLLCRTIGATVLQIPGPVKPKYVN